MFAYMILHVCNIWNCLKKHNFFCLLLIQTMYSQQNKINSGANGYGNIESPTKTPLPYVQTYKRTGCMAAFESFTQFEQYLDEIRVIMEDPSSPIYVSPRIVDALKSGSKCRLRLSLNVSLSLGDQWPPDQETVEGLYQKIPRLT
ncbi:uncharacterized protein LOC107882517 isoform X2 [Acyrthosiphon pisum]|uniref:Uncharacterized protein n=1 Tax=Acyrthosiphon pisum TaxID=7029 RepID=A0A8R2D1M9_ACYPI|nr:uncharacterized protein LOC107882517 isoform X2 [Acyrthosiphon pisum]XP_016656423.1 uncharacterized protein LOC107882517 isoform X2 [Acyrthosiphon pisum]|eukprot:XP_016656420.1 PREDICTED: uncharacterized protein LOC107882517 [Acyrthosiphon pisum]